MSLFCAKGVEKVSMVTKEIPLFYISESSKRRKV